MQKVFWQNDGDNVRLAMPIHKVNQTKRTVSGWASLDNIDQHNDLVDADASREAFTTFRGNIREMHDEKKAVGKLVDFKEDTLYVNGKFYQGVYVTAYVSKGAEDTWQKVLDGTLSGFSIGGNVIEAQNDIDPETGQPFRRVKKYMLTELSLVDNPANQFSNVDSITKVIGVAGTAEDVELTGDLADITIENVFVCNSCLDDGHGVHKSSTESLVCPICDGTMIKIGFVESSDPEPRDTIQKMIDNHLADREGGVNENMPEENVQNENEETVEVTEVEEVEAPAEEQTEAPAEEEAATEEETATEETVEVEEVADPLTEAVTQLRELTTRIESSSAARAEEVAELKKSLSELDRSFEERLTSISGQVETLQSRQDEFSKKFEGIDESISEVRKGLTDLDSATALKKSADFDQPAAQGKSKESIWAGSFLNIESL